jgi:GT2 family glycosyltransferase
LNPAVEVAEAPRSTVSLVIPNYNGVPLLPTCLDAVAGQRRQPDETLVVDDASTDGSLDLLRERYPWVRVLSLPRNLGFVGAVNHGFAHAKGQIVALLNTDTEAEPGWLESLVAPLEADPLLGCTASKLLLFDRRDTVHAAGDGYSAGGVPINRGAWTRDDGRFDAPELIFGASGGAAAYRASMLRELGGFDPWLISYLEDTDLSWRAQLRGYRCLFVPQARVYHHIGASGGGIRPSYFCGRNFVLVLARDVPGPLLRRYWWRIVREQGAIVCQALRHVREPAARARIKGYLAGLIELRSALRRRASVQRARTVSIEYLDSLLTR